MTRRTDDAGPGESSAIVVPPATIGMLGGGQLGRYALMAARQMGYRTAVVDPDSAAPAGAIADVHVTAAFDDPAALELLALCDVVTVEFENPPAAALERLAEQTRVAPSAETVAVTQDRRAEKRFLREIGVPVAPFAVVEQRSDLDLVVAAGGALAFPAFPAFPAVLKTSRGGYDGKGQVDVASGEQLESAWEALGAVPCVLEQRLDLDAEVSVVLARSRRGELATYPVAANSHRDGILDVTVVPAAATATLAAAADDCARTIAEALDYVGVLAVEMFVVDGRVLVNELAPRPHNSGHWTLDAAATNQFTQQLRAVCGLPLGPTGLTAPAAAMANLLGDLWASGEPRWDAALADPTIRLHLYGKQHPRPSRKMGHVTATADTIDEARARVTRARSAL